MSDRKETTSSSRGRRPEVSVFWLPGCSSCLRLKEFVERHGIEFESINLLETPGAKDEIIAAGLKGGPVIRKGDTYIRGEYLDRVAQLLGISIVSNILPKGELIERWSEILGCARNIVAWFPYDQLERRAMLIRERTVKDLCMHVYQIPHTFIKQARGELRVEDERASLSGVREDIVSRDNLLAYVDEVIGKFSNWRESGGEATIPSFITTCSYGEQSSHQVLERGVWHTAQHARQIDAIAVGLGAEYQISPRLYQGLPLPERLWA